MGSLCCAALFLYAVYLGALGVLLPFIGTAFHLGPAAEGRLFPANFGGFIIGVLLCGSLSDRLGRKPVLLGGVAAYAFGLTLFSRAASFDLGILATGLVGAGSGAMETVATALAADLYPERRAFWINALQVAFGVGAAISPSLAHHLLIAGTSWRWLYLSLAAANAVLFLALAIQAIPHTRHPDEALDLTTLRAIVRQPIFLMICGAEALYVGAETGFSSWMPTYFLADLRGGAAWAGLVVTVFWIGMTIGRAATGSLMRHVPLLRLTLLLAGGGLAGAALAPVCVLPSAVLACVAWTGLCFSGIFGLILAEATERYPRYAGTALGAVVASGGVGGAIVPWAVGAAGGMAVGWRGALALVPLVMACLAALIFLIERQTAAGK
jgi:FHS family glucose/mannose:H+ symporter-like MFS transporter